MIVPSLRLSFIHEEIMIIVVIIITSSVITSSLRWRPRKLNPIGTQFVLYSIFVTIKTRLEIPPEQNQYPETSLNFLISIPFNEIKSHYFILRPSRHLNEPTCLRINIIFPSISARSLLCIVCIWSSLLIFFLMILHLHLLSAVWVEMPELHARDAQSAVETNGEG